MKNKDKLAKESDFNPSDYSYNSPFCIQPSNKYLLEKILKIEKMVQEILNERRIEKDADKS